MYILKKTLDISKAMRRLIRRKASSNCLLCIAVSCTVIYYFICIFNNNYKISITRRNNDIVIRPNNENNAIKRHTENNDATIRHSENDDAIIRHTENHDAIIRHSENNDAIIRHTENNDAIIRYTENTDDIIRYKEKNPVESDTAEKVTHLMYWERESLFDDVTCKTDNTMTSCEYSKVKLLNTDTTTQTVEVGIYLYDRNGKVKRNGGDVILVWAQKLPSGGNAAGKVDDHMNGTFTGRVQVPWAGRTKISVKLASAKETLCLRFRAMKKYGNSVFAMNTPNGIHFEFRNGSVSEFTRCMPHTNVYGYKALCNFTEVNHGFSWYCGKPTKEGLDCKSYDKVQHRRYNKSEIIPNRSPDEVIQIPDHCEFQQNVEVYFSKKVLPSIGRTWELMNCHQRPKKDSWTDSNPSGYAVNGKWKFSNCFNFVKFEARNLKTCLKGKLLVFIGDGTLRQYHETLNDVINSDFEQNPALQNLDIKLVGLKHEMPQHSQNLVRIASVKSSAFHIDKLANDDSVVAISTFVIVHYGLNLQASPPSIFISRLRLLAEALRRLLAKKPGVTIFIKGAAPVIEDIKWYDVRISLIFNEILFEEFAPLQDHVIYLDVFSISVANNNELSRPQGQTLINQVQQLLSYICKA